MIRRFWAQTDSYSDYDIITLKQRLKPRPIKFSNAQVQCSPTQQSERLFLYPKLKNFLQKAPFLILLSPSANHEANQTMDSSLSPISRALPIL